MNYTMGVGIFQGIANLDQDVHELFQVIALPVIKDLSQGITVHQFHCEVIVPA